MYVESQIFVGFQFWGVQAVDLQIFLGNLLKEKGRELSKYWVEEGGGTHFLSGEWQFGALAPRLLMVLG